jgi:hypothetical protein
MLGLRVSDLVSGFELNERELIPYTYPSDEALKQVGVTGLFLGHYFPWDGLGNALVAQANGFKSFGLPVEGSMVDYENLDNYQHGIHDYFKFLKFGFGRATDIASLHIRRQRISRSQGLQIVKARDGKYPWSYLGKPLEEILDRIDLSIDEFNKICLTFTNKNLFKMEFDGSISKEKDGSLIKVNYDNVE